MKDKRCWAKHCADQAKVMGGIDVFSLLIMPVQRLPRYRLLVKELLMSTAEDATFRTHLENALQNVERALDITNRSV